MRVRCTSWPLQRSSPGTPRNVNEGHTPAAVQGAATQSSPSGLRILHPRGCAIGQSARHPPVHPLHAHMPRAISRSSPPSLARLRFAHPPSRRPPITNAPPAGPVMPAEDPPMWRRPPSSRDLSCGRRASRRRPSCRAWRLEWVRVGAGVLDKDSHDETCSIHTRLRAGVGRGLAYARGARSQTPTCLEGDQTTTIPSSWPNSLCKTGPRFRRIVHEFGSRQKSW